MEYDFDGYLDVRSSMSAIKEHAKRKYKDYLQDEELEFLLNGNEPFSEIDYESIVYDIYNNIDYSPEIYDREYRPKLASSTKNSVDVMTDIERLFSR